LILLDFFGKTSGTDGGKRFVDTYCYNCVAGPDLLRVEVRDGVATAISPNHAGIGIWAMGARRRASSRWTRRA